MIVRTRGAISLNLFAMMLLSVCSGVTMDCCVLYPCCLGVFGMLQLCKAECSSSVSLQLLRGIRIRIILFCKYKYKWCNKNELKTYNV